MTIWLSNLIATAACAVIALRLLTFRRGQRRHSRVWAMAAWVLINACLLLTLHLIWGALSHEALRWHGAILLSAAAIQTIRARGNAAKLWRLHP